MIFDQLVDGIELELSKVGVPYHRGVGDYAVIQDDYENNEVAVVILRKIVNDDVVRNLQNLLRLKAPDWKIRVGANQGLDWNADQDLLIASDRIWSEARD